MIINIRGTGCSGKSWVVRQLMERYGATPIEDKPGRIFGYNLDTAKTRIVGRYNVESGGCDRINTQEEVAQRINTFVLGSRAETYNVIFEGLLVSGIYGRWRDFAQSVSDFRWVFLNTTLEQCLENTRQRRIKAGKPPEFNPESTAGKHPSVRSIYHKTRYDRLNSFDVSSAEAVDLIAGWIA